MASQKREMICGLLMGGISLSPDADEKEACSICATELKRAGVNPAQLHFEVRKRSVDARKKDDVRIVWSVAAKFSEPRYVRFPLKCRYSVTPLCDEEMEIPRGTEKCTVPPLVVGMGPAGLFCALLPGELLAKIHNVWQLLFYEETLRINQR